MKRLATSVILCRSTASTSAGARVGRLLVTACLAVFLLLAGCESPAGVFGKSDQDDAPAIRRVTEHGSVTLTVSVVPATPRLSDVVQLQIQVSAPPEFEIHPPAFGAAVGDFLVLGYTELPTSDTDSQSPRTVSSTNSAGQSVRRFQYQLEPVFAGTHLIRSIEIEFSSRSPVGGADSPRETIASDPIEVLVTSELDADIPDLSALEPMLPPQPLPGSFWNWWPGPAAVFLLAAGLFVWLRRRRRQECFEPVQPTPREVAADALRQLLSEQLSQQGRFKEFYVRLTGIVRVYIEATTGLRAPEQTTEEFLAAMHRREVFPSTQTMQLREFLQAADMVKYAGQQPDAEQIQLSITRAHKFVGVLPADVDGDEEVSVSVTDAAAGRSS